MLSLFLAVACFRGYDHTESEAVEGRKLCVKQLIEAGANPNFQKCDTGYSPMHWAAFNDDLSVVSYLLKSKGVMTYSAKDETPIDVAGFCQNYGVAF